MGRLLLIIGLVVTGAFSKWIIDVEKDEMTGEKSCYVSSGFVKATKHLERPYDDLQQAIGIGIDSNDKLWTYLAFTTNPNLTDDETKSSYSLATRRMKFDEDILELSQTQDWGSRFIHFSNDETFVMKLLSSKILLTEQEQYGNGKVYYRHQVKGFLEAYNSARKKCGLSSLNVKEFTEKIQQKNKYEELKSWFSDNTSYGDIAKEKYVIIKEKLLTYDALKIEKENDDYFVVKAREQALKYEQEQEQIIKGQEEEKEKILKENETNKLKILATPKDNFSEEIKSNLESILNTKQSLRYQPAIQFIKERIKLYIDTYGIDSEISNLQEKANKL